MSRSTIQCGKATSRACFVSMIGAIRVSHGESDASLRNRLYTNLFGLSYLNLRYGKIFAKQTSQIGFFAFSIHSVQLQGLPKSQLLLHERLVWKGLETMLGFKKATCLATLLQLFVAAKLSTSRLSILVYTPWGSLICCGRVAAIEPTLA